jgi:hypothetical protein
MGFGELIATYTGRILPPFLSDLLAMMVKSDQAVYDPPKQTRSILLYWRRPEEWAEALYEWVRILCFPFTAHVPRSPPARPSTPTAHQSI